MEEQSLSRYIEDSEEELMAATRRENILNVWNGEDTKHLKHRLMQEHKEPIHSTYAISYGCPTVTKSLSRAIFELTGLKNVGS